ncbi:MAG: sulfite exporter TauE/SafE family protein [Pseudobutyrivibrio ruminis]|nr:sulfite exporter TauE/SafE family protein [Pseudobutyrivibrio ruminis]
MSEIITSIVSFIAFLIHSITGFGGNIMVFPVLTYLYGSSTARICLNLIAWISSISITIDCHKDINVKEYIRIIIWMALGLGIGYLLIPYMKSESIIMTIYGFIIILIALQRMLLKDSIVFNKPSLIIILILAGVIQALFVSGGAFLVIYCTQALTDKKEFRATFTAVWLSIYTSTFFIQLLGRGYEKEHIKIALFGAIPVIFASVIGSRITRKINQQFFMRIVYIFILIVGISLVASNVMH